MASQSYVQGLQKALWNHAASLGGEVPKQSRPHLAAGIKIRDKIYCTGVGAMQVQKQQYKL